MGAIVIVALILIKGGGFAKIFWGNCIVTNKSWYQKKLPNKNIEE
jgi:hypothetical protein